MGLFAKFKSYRDNQNHKKTEKAQKLIKNPKAAREDRWGALQFMAEYDDVAAAVPILLQRFEYSLEHGINDTKEKELAMKGIIAHGAKALPYLREHLTKTTRIAWPIKILKDIADDKVVVETLRAALDFKDVSFDQSAVDKNYDILCYLRDYNVPGLLNDLKHFLNDPDERVRFAAVEAIIEQDDPGVAHVLEPFLVDHSPENRRIKLAAITAFLKHHWKVQDPVKFNGLQIEPGIVLNPVGGLEIQRSALQ